MTTRWMMVAITGGAIALSAGAVAQQKPVVTASASSDKLICRSQGETGSLVRAKKRCFTQKDWTRINDSQQRGARKLVEELAERSMTN